MILTSERLILRKPKKRDCKDILEACQSKNLAKHTMRIPHPFLKKDSKDFVKKALTHWREKEYSFFIELKNENKIIGIIELIDIRTFSGTAEIVYFMNPKYQGKGYMTEANIIINNFAFNKLKLRKTLLYIFSGNTASTRISKKLGYKLEGKMIKNCRATSTGKIHDVEIYSLFKNEWKKIYKKLKK